jgi:hypothetical protein
MNPLGKYAQLVAAIISVGIIGAYVVVEVLYAAGVVTNSPDGLKTAALIALGAVFGSFATINGVKQPIESAHNRIDKLEVGTGIPTHTVQ